MSHSHRATTKPGHKSFKSKHATKSALKARYKGKVEKDSNGKGKPYTVSKLDRRNTANQIKANKVSEVLENKRIFGGRSPAPKIVTVIPLSLDCDPISIINQINGSLGMDKLPEVPNPGSVTVTVERFKQNIRYIVPRRNFIEILDAAKVADFVVFVLSATTEVDEFGELCIRSIESQGVSSTIPIIYGLPSVGNAKRQADVRGSLTSYFQHFFPTAEKLFSVDVTSEALNVGRMLCQKFAKGINWRDSRPYILADEVSFDADSNCVVVEGFVRGRGINVDRLVHIPGYGDFQLERIVETTTAKRDSQMQTDVAVFLPSDGQETLDELVPYDEEMDFGDEDMEEQQGVRLDGHHYLGNSTKYDYDSDREEDETHQHAKRLPEGMSEYQSTWIVDQEEEGEEIDELVDMDSDIELNGEEPAFGESGVTASEYAPTEAGDTQSEMFVELDEEEEASQLKRFRGRVKEDLDFPDEIELDPSVSVKDRLQRYRGLKNLRTCTWDVDERDPRAPEEWRGLTRISNFRATRNRVAKQAIQQAQVQAGTRVQLFIRAPEFVARSYTGESVFVVYGLLQYEHKLAVVNLSITPNSEFTESIPSKDTLIAQCGPRRIVIRPLFSQAGSNAANNVYKYERFMHPGRTATATVIAPITMGNLPVTYFKQRDDRLELVGSGSVLDTNASRILAKRIILTGHPLKIHKKLVTVRYMFFNAEDIAWYKAVPLFTNNGRSGYIKESLGTHGYFKATFDGKLTSQDTIGMALYKRVWPRVSMLWTGM